MQNYDLTILNNSGEKKILIVGVFHGDEPQGEYHIREFLKTKPEIKKNALFFIPRLNSENTRTNKNGVDLNRNFPTKNWQKTEKNEFFGGNSPASEPEVKFILNLMEKNKFDAIITIHAPFKIVNYDGPALELAKKVSSIVKYSLQKDIGYPTFGSFGTFCGIENNIPTITIEVDETISPDAEFNRFQRLFFYLGNEL